MYNNREHLIEEFSKPFSVDKNGNIIREQITETVYEIDEELLNEMIKKNVNVKPKEGETYKEFFKRAMKEYGIDDITDMNKEEKDKFFQDIEYTWDKEDPKTNDKDKVDESINMDKFRNLPKIKQGQELEDYINKKFKTIHLDDDSINSKEFMFIEEEDNTSILKKVEKMLNKEGFNTSYINNIPAISVN